MLSLSTELGRNPLNIFGYIARNWKMICRYACSEVYSSVVKQRHLGLYPPSFELTGDSSLMSAFEEYGFTLVGEWQDASNVSQDRSKGILIHWPTLTRIIPFLAFSSVRFQAFSLMYWGIADVLRRRSMLYHNLLFRQYLGTYRERSKSTAGWDKLPPLDVYQQTILDKLHHNAANDSSLWKMFSSIFKKTMGASAQMMPSAKSAFAARIPASRKHEFSCFRTVKYRQISSYLPTFPPTAEIVHGDFSGSKVSPELEELLYLRHLPRDEHAHTGVLLDTEVHPNRNVRVVNMALYSKFRTSMGGRFYSQLCRQMDYPVKKDFVVEAHAVEYAQHFEEKYDELKLPVATVGDYFPFIAKHWPGTSDINGFLFVPMPLLHRRVLVSRRMEAIRPSISKAASRKAVESRSSVIKPAPKEVFIPSPPIAEAGDIRFDIYMVRIRNKTYFRVPWELSMKYRAKPGSDVENPTPASGAYIHVESGRWYFTLVRLKSDPESPVLKFNSLHEWMRAYGHLTKSRYKKFGVQADRMHVNPDKRSEKGKTPRGLLGERFKQDEDAIIVQLYRPGMKDTDKEHILQVCLGRRWEAIVLRANVLRNRMIKDGIVDLDRLPHQNYNAALGKKLAKHG